MASTSFSPEILHSYPRLHHYLLGKEADEIVKNQVLEACRHPVSGNWLGTRRFIPLLITDIFKFIFGIFAKAISCLLAFVCLKNWSNRVNIYADLAFHGLRSTDYWTHGENLLIPAYNSYSPACIDLYMQSKLLKRSLQDVEVRKAINPTKTHLKFHHNTGNCRGSSLWFIRHYFKTKSLFTDPREHMRALGQLFYWGTPPQAALLQKMCTEYEFAQLQKTSERIFNCPKFEPGRLQRLGSELKNLPVGAYLLVIPVIEKMGHALVYICEKQGEGYLFDPALGTVSIQGQEGFDKLAAHLLDNQLRENLTSYKVEIETIAPKTAQA